MDYYEYISFFNAIEKLKCNTRHSWTSTGRQESVADHSWRLAVMVLLCADEYPSVDINKVLKMCLIHDFGEAITGDIPAFKKSVADKMEEESAVIHLISMLPKSIKLEFSDLFDEISAEKTPEAKLFKALDHMEALISHNEAPISTWTEQEYQLNLTYGEETAAWSEWTKGLREQIKEDTRMKIRESKRLCN